MTWVALFAVLSAGFTPVLAGAATPDSCSETDAPHLRYERPYVALRRLEADYVGSDKHAWMDVRTELTRDPRLVVEVLAEGGAPFILERALRGYLKREQELVAKGVPARAPIRPENYICTAVGGGTSVVRVGLIPRRKAPNLIAGTMLMTPATGEVTRVEGQLSKNPSFWVTRVDVAWTYARVAGAMLPVSLDATARLKLFGAATFRMTYQYIAVDGKPVPSAMLASAPTSPD